MTYDADGVGAYFDRFAEREWNRLEETLQGRVKYVIHRRLLERHVRPGMRVLDVGCGPGRFAIDIVQLGARPTLVDLSRVQLDLARDRLTECGAVSSVDGFHRLDVLDLTSLDEGSYDVVVCFGGPVSYTTHRHVDALRQLARVARPGAPLLVSVMSLFGALRLIGPLDAASILGSPDDHLDWEAILAGADIIYTKAGSSEFHQPLALFTSEGLRRALAEAGLETETIASSNPLLPEFLDVPRIDENAGASKALMALELALCEQPGLRDTGGHLVAVARKPAR